MFKGFKWYDWVLGFMSYGLWILYKLHKNGAPVAKIFGYGFLASVLVIAGALIYSSTDSGKITLLESALRQNNLSSAERIAAESPNLKTNSGLTAAEVVEKIKANLQAERIAKEIAEAERLAEAEKKAAEQLALAQANGYNTYEEYRVAEVNKQAQVERLRAEAEVHEKAKAESERLAKDRADRTVLIDRNELGRVIARPEKYLGKIVRYKDSVDWDYVVQFGIIDSGRRNNFVHIYDIRAKGAEWSRELNADILMPRDIYDKMDDDFYNASKKNIGNLLMQTNEIELLPMEGSNFKKLFGKDVSPMYVHDDNVVLIVTKVNIYNRSLGMYETHFFK